MSFSCAVVTCGRQLGCASRAPGVPLLRRLLVRLRPSVEIARENDDAPMGTQRGVRHVARTAAVPAARGGGGGGDPMWATEARGSTAGLARAGRTARRQSEYGRRR